MQLPISWIISPLIMKFFLFTQLVLGQFEITPLALNCPNSDLSLCDKEVTFSITVSSLSQLPQNIKQSFNSLVNSAGQVLELS